MKQSTTSVRFLASLAAAMTLASGPAWAGDAQDVLDAQALYEEVLKAGLGEPYLAPIPDNPTGPLYLWGGLDPIDVISRFEGRVADDPGGTLFISRSGSSGTR